MVELIVGWFFASPSDAVVFKTNKTIKRLKTKIQYGCCCKIFEWVSWLTNYKISAASTLEYSKNLDSNDYLPYFR